MTHEDAGHYAAKHPRGTSLNAAVAAEVEKRSEQGTLTCAAAHAIAGALDITPGDVGGA